MDSENEERDIGGLLKQVNLRMHVRGDAALRDTGLTFSQMRVVAFLCGNEGVATQKAIEEHLLVSHPTVVGMVGRMERNGFVECSVDPKDRRNRIVRLTEKAWAACRTEADFRKRSEETILAGFSPEESRKLREYLMRMIGNLDAENPDFNEKLVEMHKRYQHEGGNER